MARLVPMTSDDPAALGRQVAAALDGGPAVGLGMVGGALDYVPAGTAVVIETSGSTGVPKRVALSGEALRASAEATAERLGSGLWLLALPPSYVAGLQVLIRSHLAGRAPAVLNGRFSPDAFVDATRALVRAGYPALYTSLVPAQLATLLEASSDPGVVEALRAYRAILVGGQALPEPFRDRALQIGASIVRTYGSTETCGGCVYDGRPLDSVAVRTVDGELQIAGPVLADEYLGKPELTESTFLRDELGIRWYRTGDLGLVEDGVVKVHGRADNVIVSGGINISLDRVERVVRGVPSLSAAVVIGVTDERWGEASVIVVEGTPQTLDGVDLLVQARNAVSIEIGPHARPSRMVSVAEIPVLASGKPDRQALRRGLTLSA